MGNEIKMTVEMLLNDLNSLHTAIADIIASYAKTEDPETRNLLEGQLQTKLGQYALHVGFLRSLEQRQ
jgi:hypothetical protein